MSADLEDECVVLINSEWCVVRVASGGYRVRCGDRRGPVEPWATLAILAWHVRRAEEAAATPAAVHADLEELARRHVATAQGLSGEGNFWQARREFARAAAIRDALIAGTI